MPSPLDILKQYFNYESFKPSQEDVINAVLKKEDVLAVLPTGGGKSVCFQVPALMNEGMCLVISPLIALMKDQVANLRKKGITAFAINSGMTRKEVVNTLRVAGESNCKFLYVSPERLETNLFKEFLPSLHITLIAVDEGHCISQWGYDFRPSYLRIAELREELIGVPVLALTASATKEVQEDICTKLDFRNRNIVRQSFAHTNLSYSVFKVESKFNKIKDILEKISGSSIIYCRSRRHTKEISDWLNLQGISADYYHAGLPGSERSLKQESWIKNNKRVMVSTNAFGMGIDKPDVSTVIHADVPDCLENYYQEAGRAGRDGKKSYAVLLFKERELEELQEQPTLHFPSLENIRWLYQSLMNYLQIASGTGEGNYFDFDMTDFIKKFKIDLQLVIYGLRTLEQEGLLSFQDQFFVPSKIEFTIDKRSLNEFEKNNPSLQPIIQVLLRTYPGVFDQPVYIREGTISFLMKKDMNKVINELKTLHGAGIIQYLPQKDSPQLYFIQNRVNAQDLKIDEINYLERKKRYEHRIRLLLQYVKNDSQCRNSYIANYFGDGSVKDCGICDNCLRNKKLRADQEHASAQKLIIDAE